MGGLNLVVEPAMENALSPYVTVLDLGILRSSCEQDRSDRTLQRLTEIENQTGS